LIAGRIANLHYWVPRKYPKKEKTIVLKQLLLKPQKLYKRHNLALMQGKNLFFFKKKFWKGSKNKDAKKVLVIRFNQSLNFLKETL
jgi:hypothetical protein